MYELTSAVVSVLAPLTIAFGLMLVAYLVHIVVKSSTPFCLSWLIRAVANTIIASVFLLGILIWKKHTMLFMLFSEYLFLSSLYLYALWQTKFTTHKPKHVQKLYIFLLNTFLFAVGFKFFLKFINGFIVVKPVGASFLNPTSAFTSQTVSLFASLGFGVIFMVLYAMYTAYNVSDKPKYKLTRTVTLIEGALGIMILYNIAQIVPEQTISMVSNSGAISPRYLNFFMLNMMIKSILNLAYMALTWRQVKAEKGLFMSDNYKQEVKR